MLITAIELKTGGIYEHIQDSFYRIDDSFNDLDECNSSGRFC
jgi:hypothetical protein